MKNYEIKSAEELNGAKQSGNRIAFLVLNMYKRVSNGYLKHLPAKTVVETPVQEEIPVQNVQPVQEVTASVVENVQPLQQVEQVQTEKPYESKAFNGNVVKTDNNPRRLLISTAFKAKLVANRAAKLVNNVTETVTNTIEVAVNRYHELLDKRSELIQEVKNIEEEITRLVKENNLTQEQVNSRARVA